MTLQERKEMALRLLKEIDEIIVVPGFDQLKEDMAAVLREMAEKISR